MSIDPENDAMHYGVVEKVEPYECDPVLFIARRAQDLCDLAKQMGVVLEVTLDPQTPLAMRNYSMKVSTRARRDNKE